MRRGSSQTHQQFPGVPIFDAIFPDLMIESIRNPDHPERLLLHVSDGRKYVTAPDAHHGGRTYTPASIAGGLAQSVRFPNASKPFGSPTKLAASMFGFLSRYAYLSPDGAWLLVAFALASWFADCVPVAPVLYLLGPENETRSVLRLLGCLCRRSVLLGDLDVAALATLPNHLDASLLIDQRNLTRRVTRVLLASTNRYFRVAHGKGQLNTYGARAFSAVPEFANGTGVRVSLSPAQEPLETLTEADERESTDDFQARLLRYRMVNHRRARNAQVDTRDFVPAMRDEARAWLAPICDCPDLQKSVTSSFLQRSQDVQGDRLSNDQCVVAEAALFFCHEPNTEFFFIGDLAETVNDLLKGRHDDRVLTDKKVGLLLRALGIHGQRVVQGYRILLTEAARREIHRIANAFQVISTQDGIARCAHCRVGKVDGLTN